MTSQTRRLQISGMHCPSCGLLIDEAVTQLPGVSECRTDARKEITTLTFDPTETTLEQISGTIAEVGYQVVSEAEVSTTPYPGCRRLFRSGHNLRPDISAWNLALSGLVQLGDAEDVLRSRPFWLVMAAARTSGTPHTSRRA